MERTIRRERWFKRLILLVTTVGLFEILWTSPYGRYGVATGASEAREVIRHVLGLPRPRAEVDADWERFRRLGIETSRGALEHAYTEADPSMKRLMRYAGLDPDQALVRWGNFNLTLLLPSKVFEADDRGRSYRLRPRTRSIWLRNVSTPKGALMFYLVPDGPGLTEAIHGTSAIPVEASRQWTNSWGLRGPEPDPDAPLRGIVLGDSFMEGLFVGDDDTPPEYLRRYLQRESGKRVSVLNTGVMGYSPEQYYHALMAFADRFPPDFVVVSVFTNDFGDLHEVPTHGQGDWDEGKYWLDRIAETCRLRGWPHVVVPVPYAPSMFSKRKSGYYPGLIANILDDSGLMFLNPTDAFINAHLERYAAAEARGERPKGCALFNESIGDGHFSPLGAEVWAASVGRRLVLLMKKAHVWPGRPANPHHETAMDPSKSIPPIDPSRPAPPAAAGVLRPVASP